MSLGIGGATPFSQGSNHQTAANHQIRDNAAYDHTKQTKVKCTSCGMWASKGSNCTFCKHPAGKDWLASPKASVCVFSSYLLSGCFHFFFFFWTKKNKKKQKNSAAVPKPAEKTTVSNNANTHQHRDVKAFDHTKQTKVKCTSCGCWVKKGVASCSVCKRPTAK